MKIRELSARSCRRLSVAPCWSAVPVFVLALLPTLAVGQANYTSYTFTTLAGSASMGSADGAGNAARFADPVGVAVDTAGNIYVADTGNSTIRKITPDGTVSTLAGLAGVTGSADGIGSAARFDHPRGVAVDGTGNVYVADSDNSTIRKISPSGTVTTFAGRAGARDIADGTGDAARFANPTGVAVDSAGNVYVADSTYLSAASHYGTGNIRKITPLGVVSTPPNLYGAEYLTVDATGTVYAVSTVLASIAKMVPGGGWSAVNMTGNFRPQAPMGIAVDAAGNVEVADPLYQVVFKITPEGAVSIVAGLAGASGSTDGTGSGVRFNGPLGVAVDSAGNIYVADSGNNTIRKGQPYPSDFPPVVSASPVNRTVTAGQPTVFSVTADSSSSVSYQWQRQAGGSSAWTDLSDAAAFSGTTTATLTVNATTAAMNGDSFRCVITNAHGSVTSGAATLAVIGGTSLTVTTLAGQAGISGRADGAGSAALFLVPADVAADRAGTVYVADTDNHTIRKIAPDGTVTTLAGTAGSWGYVDGTGAAARFDIPSGVTVDNTGNVYVADTGNDTIRKITPAGVVTTLAGMARSTGSADGTGSAALFSSPSGIVADPSGNLYVADTLNHTIRKVTPAGVVSTLAGQAGTSGSDNGTGSAARFFVPQGLALDGAGDLYVADTSNSTIRKIVPSTGAVTTIAGQVRATGSDDGPAALARFYYPCGVAVDGAGNLYVADTDNHTIRQITPAGAVSTIAGQAGTSGGADGVGAAARFNFPTGITADSAGNLYIADTSNHTIRLAYFAAAPAITAQPQSQTVVPGASGQFSVTATGRPAPTYQWSFNGAAISGATGSTFSLSNVQPANAGSYTVTVANASGSATSTTATLTVSAGSPTPAPGGSGGGAMEAWFVLLLARLAAARWTTRKSQARGCLLSPSARYDPSLGTIRSSRRA